MKALNNYVILEIETLQEKTETGLVVPKNTELNGKNILKCGKVIEISSQLINVGIDLSIGDYVYYNKHAITTIPNDDKHILVRKEDLYFVK